MDGIVTCEYCGTKFVMPKTESAKVLAYLQMGERDLDVGKFDDAYAAYKKAAEADDSEPEAYFGMALAEFKVRYLKDISGETARLQPICYEISEKRFVQNPNYLAALSKATETQREEYERKGEEIDYIISEFLKLQGTGLDYDCFICVKVSDGNGGYTQDSKDADAIYRLLKDKGYMPFYSEYEVRNKSGADYEAHILYALYSSECMLVVCSNEDYLRTPWVKNEYSRFLKLVNDEEKESDSITIVFNKKPIERLPGRNGKLQGIDYSLRSSDDAITEFVERHTPAAHARRLQRAQEKQKAEEEQQKHFAEMMAKQAEMEEKLNNFKATGSNLSPMQIYEQMENFRREQERKEQERLAREEQERREREAREERERIARAAREHEERLAREEQERKEREMQLLIERNTDTKTKAIPFTLLGFLGVLAIQGVLYWVFRMADRVWYSLYLTVFLTAALEIFIYKVYDTYECYACSYKKLLLILYFSGEALYVLTDVLLFALLPYNKGWDDIVSAILIWISILVITNLFFSKVIKAGIEDVMDVPSLIGLSVYFIGLVLGSILVYEVSMIASAVSVWLMLICAPLPIILCSLITFFSLTLGCIADSDEAYYGSTIVSAVLSAIAAIAVITQFYTGPLIILCIILTVALNVGATFLGCKINEELSYKF